MRSSILKIGLIVGALIALASVIVWFPTWWINRSPTVVPATRPPTAIARPTPVGGGLIAFESEREGHDNIYLMQGDGSKPTRLDASTPDFDYAPAWSPDGRRLAFFSFQNRHADIYIVDIDEALQTLETASQIQLTDANKWGQAEASRLLTDTGWMSLLAWSPAGEQLAVMRSARDAGGLTGFQIYLLNTDGSGLGRRYVWAESYMDVFTLDLNSDLPPPPPPAGDFCSYPAWSPDGTRLAFIHRDDSGDDVFMMATDGSGLTNVSQTEESLVSPFAWAPTGRHIAYFTVRQQPDHSLAVELRLANMETGKRETILGLTSTLSIVSYDNLAWSPEGDRLLFTSTNANGRDQSLYLVYWDGSSLTRLADDLPWRSTSSWSPDGNWVAFVSARDGDEEIYALNVSEAFRDPENLQAVQLTHNPGSDHNPQWQPPQP